MHGERDNSVTLTPAAAAPRPAPGICSRTGSEAVSDICLRRDSSPRGEERGLCGLPARAAAGRVLSSTAPRWPGARWRAREAALGAHARPHPPSAGPRPGARVGPGKAGRALSISPRPGSWPGGKPPRGREWFLPPLGTVSSGTPDAGFLEAWPRLGEGHGTLPPAPAPREAGNAFSAQSLGSVPLPLAAQPRDCRILKIDANSYPSPFVSCLFLSFVRLTIFNFSPLLDF